MGIDSFDNYECDGQMDLTDYTENRQLTHLSLFSGVGGLDLAAEWAGFESVGQCEWADYPTKVLEKHWPDIPRWRDIRDLTGANFYERTNRRTVDVISGGFPCQPFSVAGKQRGKEDDRYLWPEMVRVIKELRPSWVVGENVAGIINMALDTVLSDLEAAGYTVRTFVLPACGVNAPHQRYRTAIVGYAKHNGLSSSEITRIITKASGGQQEGNKKTGEPERTGEPGNMPNVANAKGDNTGGLPIRESEEKPRFSKCGKDVSNTNNQGLQISGLKSRVKTVSAEDRIKLGDWWATEPGVGRVANGIPNRVDRIKCLGNAVVPAQFYPIFQAIADIELGR